MKRYLVLILNLCVAFGALSNIRLTKEEIQIAALSYYQKVTANSPKEYSVGEPESFSLLGLAEMWLLPVNDCWLLVSSDKRTEAILARFLTSEKPDLYAYPPAAQYLISCYEHNIAFVRDSCKDCPIRSSWREYTDKHDTTFDKSRERLSSVEPLLGEMAWKQSRNNTPPADCSHIYNKFCPYISTSDTTLCGHAVAGCVAVALGQIMRYWKWPYSAYVPTTVGGDTKELKFYNWDVMPLLLNNSTNIASVNAVAGLLRDIGYDTDMNYGESSGTSDNKARETFVHYGYDDNTMTLRYKLITPGWTNILHSEIAAGRPVYYGGYEMQGGGHTFVLDGYDAGDLYHVNLGWGAFYNDYYLIDTLFPDLQTAIWGIQPAANYCSPLTIQSVTGSKFCIANAGMVTLDAVQMQNITDGRIFSETGITLTEGTSIANGCHVLFDIKPIPCDPPGAPAFNNHRYMENEETVVEHITNQYAQDPPLKYLEIYSIDGKLVRQSSNMETVISSLSNGVYIVKAIMESGDFFQSKILIQK